MIHDALANTVTDATPMREALAVLDRSPVKIVLVVDTDGRLVGTCTDGDFRRAVLRGTDLNGPVLDVANRNPLTAPTTLNSGELATLARERNVKAVPVVDADGAVTGLFSEDTIPDGETAVPVVLMAGGLGRRLMPLTADCPKPLLPLGGKPMLQRIIENLRDQGFRRFYVSVNYLGHMIEDHFGDGDHLGVEISYLRESKRLGTGGALSLLPRNMHYPFLVMNGDLLTDADFTDLVDHHIATEASATMVVREHRTAIPFGVVEFTRDTYQGVTEKPTLVHHINAGVYCLSKPAREVVPEDEFYDMPTLFEDLRERGKTCSVFTLRDSWLDIGNPREYEAAKKRFADSAEEA